MASDGPRGDRPLRAGRHERGSVLMLMPAAVLVVIVLGALAVDQAVVFAAQRDLVATAQAIANDAAGAVDVDRLRSDGVVEWDATAVERAVQAAGVQAEPGTSLTWAIDGDRIVVRLSRDVPLVFSKAVPGGANARPVEARAEAELWRR